MTALGGYVAHRRSRRIDPADLAPPREPTSRERDVLDLLGEYLGRCDIRP